MTTTNNNEDLEKKIIEAAKELFIEGINIRKSSTSGLVHSP